MPDTRALLDAYARDRGFVDEMQPLGPGRAWFAPAAFAALRAVLDKHVPFQYGDEAEEFDDPSRRWCKECTNSGEFHRIRYPCATIRAITAALAPTPDLDPAQLRVEIFRDTAGSSVRITHLPTGLVSQCGSEKTETENRTGALKTLRKLLEADRG